MISFLKQGVFSLSRVAFVLLFSPLAYPHPQDSVDSTTPPEQIQLRRQKSWTGAIGQIIQMKEEGAKRDSCSSQSLSCGSFLTDDELRATLRSTYFLLTQTDSHLSGDESKMFWEVEGLLKQAAFDPEPYLRLPRLVETAERALLSIRASSPDDVVLSIEPRGDASLRANQDELTEHRLKPDHIVIDIIENRKEKALTLTAERSIGLIPIVIPWLPADFFKTDELVALSSVSPQFYRYSKKACNRRFMSLFDLIDPPLQFPLLALSAEKQLVIVKEDGERRALTEEEVKKIFEGRLFRSPLQKITREERDALIEAYLKPICKNFNVDLRDYTVRSAPEEDPNPSVVKFAQGPLPNDSHQPLIVTEKMPLVYLPNYRKAFQIVMLGHLAFCCGFAVALTPNPVNYILGPALMGAAPLICCLSCFSEAVDEAIPYLVFDSIKVRSKMPIIKRVRASVGDDSPVLSENGES